MTHAAAWDSHPLTRLVAGVDPDEGRREQFERIYHLPTYPTWGDMIAEHRPAMVSVCTPPGVHSELVIEALDAGASRVICEKPCTTSSQEARSLRARLGSDAWRVGVNFTRRFDPAHRWVFERIIQERLVAGHGFYTGGLRNTASHWLAGLLSTGSKVESVLAIPCVRDSSSPNLALRLQNGGLVCLEGGNVEDYMCFEATLFTPENRVRLVHGGAILDVFGAHDSSRYSEYRELTEARVSPPLGLSNALLAVIDDAVRSQEQHRSMRCTIEDAIAVHDVLGAAEESLRTGSWTAVDSSE